MLSTCEKNRILQNVQKGNVDVLKEFKENNLNIHWCEIRYDKNGDTILHIASRLGHVDILEYCLLNYHAGIDFKNRDDKTALHEAAQFAQYESIKLLLHHKANVNALKRADWTPLMLVCTKINLSNDNNYKCVELLLESGALINYQNKDGWTALHLICREGNEKILNLLKQYKLDIFKRSKNGRTALHVAALHGHLDIVRNLVNSGFDLNVIDNCGNMSLHEAVLGGSIEVCEYLINTQKAENCKSLNKLGFGILHLAASVGHINIIQYLLTALSIDINITSFNNLTPLHCAAKNKHENVVDFLISLGADVNMKDSYNRTPMDYLDVSHR